MKIDIMNLESIKEKILSQIPKKETAYSDTFY